jgi:hypothetical protein
LSKRSQVLLSNVESSIESSVELIPTGATVKHGLRPTISAGLMPTLATGLAGMARVDLDQADTACLGFVLDKAVQLGKAPTMQAAFIVALRTRFRATPQLGGVPDVFEVFKHDGGTWEGVLNEALREDVIVVSASPKLFSAQLFEVTFRRASAFGLQLSDHSEGASFLFLPVLLTQELTSRGDRRAIESQVYSYNGRGRGNSRRRYGDDDVERVTPTARAQISATHLIANILNEVSRYRKGQFDTPIYSSQTTGQGVPLDPVRTLVIADTSYLTVRTTNRLESRNGLPLLLGFLNLDD